MSVNSLLRMVCVFVVFCYNDGSAWDTTELCFMITSLLVTHDLFNVLPSSLLESPYGSLM